MEEKVNLLTAQIDFLNKKLDALSLAFVTKLQWKQLDTQRAGELATANALIENLTIEIGIIKSRLDILEA